MLIRVPTPNLFQRLVQRLSASKAAIRIFPPMLQAMDQMAVRLSGGRWCVSDITAGVPVVRVTAIGARSGLPRTALVIAIPEGESIIVVASNMGKRRRPAWAHNFRAHPEVTVHIQQQTVPCVVREVTGDERNRCWQKAASIYPGYNALQRYVGERLLPAFVLTPKQGAHTAHA